MEFIRKLGRNSQGTYYVTLPREIIQALNFQSKQKLVVKKSGNKIIIEDWKE